MRSMYFCTTMQLKSAFQIFNFRLPIERPLKSQIANRK